VLSDQISFPEVEYAMRRFLGLDFTIEQVPEATTLLHFRHLFEEPELGRKLLESQGRCSRRRAGSCVGAAQWELRGLPPRRR
jgi:hypothetical protein